jgi:bacillithiol system protein YtxJ
MNWLKLKEENQLDSIKEESKKLTVVIFKHSTRCSISSSALNRIERSWKEEELTQVKPYFLDLLNHRDISSQVEEHFGVKHESPQILVIKDGRCIYHASHMAINYPDVVQKC